MKGQEATARTSQSFIIGHCHHISSSFHHHASSTQASSHHLHSISHRSIITTITIQHVSNPSHHHYVITALQHRSITASHSYPHHSSCYITLVSVKSEWQVVLCLSPLPCAWFFSTGPFPGIRVLDALLRNNLPTLVFSLRASPSRGKMEYKEGLMHWY